MPRNPRATDLIVHGILDPARSMDETRKEMKGILERLVSAPDSL